MWSDLVELALPRRCIGCGHPRQALCAACARHPPVVVRHGALLVHAAVPYGGAVRRALIAYKERDRRDLARPLAGLLSTAVRSGAQPGDVLVPVPCSRAARRHRGHDHVRALARRAARDRRMPLHACLGLVRGVQDSAGLDIEAARALRSAGWRVDGAAVVAATLRRRRNQSRGMPR